jgi:zinc/manganese transport system substrate-binding protein
MARAVGLAEGTPSGLLRSMRAGSDPSPEDVEAFEAALREGSVDVLVQDGSADEGTAAGLRDVAEDAGVPVVDVTEFPPEDGAFVEWQVTQLAALAAALADEG